MRGAHPDREWLTGVSTAVEAWLSAPAGDGPTSQVTGQGAFRSAERRLSRLHGDRPALLVPSNTYGMRAVLQALGVGLGSSVLLPEVDWPSTWAAVRSLGADPVPVAVDPGTLTLSPEAAEQARRSTTRAVVVSHLHGVAADVPAVAAALPGLPVVEDCAQAFAGTLDGSPLGALGTAGVLSFGPGKPLDAGELGAVLAEDAGLHRVLAATAAHPARQVLAGVEAVSPAVFSVRPHPIAAVLLDHLLDRWDGELRRREHAELARELEDAGVAVLGVDGRRRNAATAVPVRAQAEELRDLPGIVTAPSPAWRWDGRRWSPAPTDVHLVRRERS